MKTSYINLSDYERKEDNQLFLYILYLLCKLWFIMFNLKVVTSCSPPRRPAIFCENLPGLNQVLWGPAASWLARQPGQPTVHNLSCSLLLPGQLSHAVTWNNTSCLRKRKRCEHGWNIRASVRRGLSDFPDIQPAAFYCSWLDVSMSRTVRAPTSITPALWQLLEDSEQPTLWIWNNCVWRVVWDRERCLSPTIGRTAWRNKLGKIKVLQRKGTWNVQSSPHFPLVNRLPMTSRHTEEKIKPC